TILTHLRVPVDGVTASQARGLMGGQIGDWREVGSPYSLGAHVFTLVGLPTPASVASASWARPIAGTSQLPAAPPRPPGSLALVPVELADWSVRNLGVDGVYPAQGRGDTSQAALPPFTLTLGASRVLVAKGLDVARLAQALGSLLAAAATTVDMVVV